MRYLFVFAFVVLPLFAHAGSHDDKHANLLRKVGNQIAQHLGDGRAKVGYFSDGHYYLTIDTQNPFTVNGTRYQRGEYLRYYCPNIYSDAWANPDFPFQYRVIASQDVIEGEEGGVSLRQYATIVTCINPR